MILRKNHIRTVSSLIVTIGILWFQSQAKGGGLTASLLSDQAGYTGVIVSRSFTRINPSNSRQFIHQALYFKHFILGNSLSFVGNGSFFGAALLCVTGIVNSISNN